MSALAKKGKSAHLIVGGESRADFMPAQVRALVRGKKTRRALVGIVVLAFLAAGGSYGWASHGSAQSLDRLDAERTQTQELLQQQGEFSAARAMASELDTARAAQRVGASTEVLWHSYIDEVRATAPEGTTITAFAIDGGSPMEPFAQAGVPLQGNRIATVSLTASSASFPDVRGWLERLEKTSGFADGLPGDVSRDETTGVYAVTMTVHITAELFANRFAEGADK